VPYSFFRISGLSGYGAGNRASQFYQSVWELGPEGDLEEFLARHAVAILKRARREGESVSSADAISVAQHARMLAALRRPPAPILDDIHDAVITCCCKGSLWTPWAPAPVWERSRPSGPPAPGQRLLASRR
jgi:hypothetical protein